MADTTFIYGLVDPNTRELRYVGRANIIARRHREHILEAQVGQSGPRGAWIRSLLANGQEPETVILEEVSKRDAPRAEQRWIAHYQQTTDGLCNVRTTCAPMETDTKIRPTRTRARPTSNRERAAGPPPASMDAEEFGTILQRLGISRRRLAIRIGVDPASITRWAAGTRPIPPYIAQALRNIDISS